MRPSGPVRQWRCAMKARAEPARLQMQVARHGVLQGWGEACVRQVSGGDCLKDSQWVVLEQKGVHKTRAVTHQQADAGPWGAGRALRARVRRQGQPSWQQQAP